MENKTMCSFLWHLFHILKFCLLKCLFLVFITVAFIILLLILFGLHCYHKPESLMVMRWYNVNNK